MTTTACEIQNYDEMLLLLKEEVEYGNLVAAANTDALLIRDAKVSILGTKAELNAVNPEWGNDMTRLVGKALQITGTTFLSGSGGAGDLPGLATLMRIAGHGENQVAGVKAEYTPAQTDIPSASAYFHHDTDLWSIAGCRANFDLTITPMAFGEVAITIMGLFTMPAHNTLALPDPDMTNWADPEPIEYDTMPQVSVHGHNAVLESYTFNLGNVLKNVNKPNCKEIRITGRKPTASMSIGAPRLDVIDFYAIADDGTLGAVLMQLGVGDGNEIIHNLTATQIEMEGLETSNNDGDKGLTLPLNVRRDPAGGPQFKFVWQ